MPNETAPNINNAQKVLDSLKPMFGSNADVYELIGFGSDGTIQIKFKLKASNQFMVKGKLITTEELTKEKLSKLLIARVKGCLKVEFV